MNKLCAVCGKPLPEDRYRVQRVYCSYSCRMKATRVRKRENYEPVPETERTCVVCGEKFFTKKPGIHLYCSDTCQTEGFLRNRRRYWRKQHAERPLCKYCGKHRVNIKGADTCGYCRKALKQKSA